MPAFKGVTINCNCPDASRQQSFILNSNSFSHSYSRDWSPSKAGAKEGFCKHIWATLILLKLISKDDIPRDVPIDIFDGDEGGEKEIYQPAYKGHSFSYDSTFRIPEFRFYRGG